MANFLRQIRRGLLCRFQVQNDARESLGDGVMDIASHATALFQNGGPPGPLLKLFALGYIANGRRNKGAIHSLDGAQADFDGELATVFSHYAKFLAHAHQADHRLSQIGRAVVRVPSPKAVGHENFDRLANQFPLCVREHVLCLGIYHDDSSFWVNKDDRIRCGLHDSPELLLGLLQLSQIPKHGIAAIYFATVVSAGHKINVDISSPGLLEKEVTLEAGALASQRLLYVRLDSVVDFLTHDFPSRQRLGLF